jgi:hypothetical protein
MLHATCLSCWHRWPPLNSHQTLRVGSGYETTLRNACHLARSEFITPGRVPWPLMHVRQFWSPDVLPVCETRALLICFCWYTAAILAALVFLVPLNLIHTIGHSKLCERVCRPPGGSIEFLAEMEPWSVCRLSRIIVRHNHHAAYKFTSFPALMLHIYLAAQKSRCISRWNECLVHIMLG